MRVDLKRNFSALSTYSKQTNKQIRENANNLMIHLKALGKQEHIKPKNTKQGETIKIKEETGEMIHSLDIFQKTI